MPVAARPDLEDGAQFDDERDALLQDSTNQPIPPRPSCCSLAGKRFGYAHLLVAFTTGLAFAALIQLVFGFRFLSHCRPVSDKDLSHVVTPPLATNSRIFPTPAPTDAYSSLFPTEVGYPGWTLTGSEPAVLATAPSYPIHTGAPQLVVPEIFGGRIASEKFSILKSWGNLSPWYSVGRTSFGLDTTPGVPDTCRVTGMHLLHRHGARYPTGFSSYGGPSKLAKRLQESPGQWHATGNLEFLNDWTFKLGEAILTPFGRQQMYDLGVSMRMKYGFLLNDFAQSNTIPVFRTESQDRMLKSALNFALGFFGYPLEGQYHQSVTIEAFGFNNTLAPYFTCPNEAIHSKGGRGLWYMRKWASLYLEKALARLQTQIHGFNLTIEDAFIMQETCAYETVALGYSKFCELFTEEEWRGFDYGKDLKYWYKSAFGSPVARAQGIGYIQELVARLTGTPIARHGSTTNSTLDDNPTTFPLGQSLYVDATHEVVVLNVITALNLTNFAAAGPLPYDHIPENRSFKLSELAPFGTNVQFQLLECTSVPGQQIRIIINDGVTPLTGIKGCPEQKDGMCPVETFVAAQKEIIADTDWDYECRGEWEVPEGTGWNTTTGTPPRRL